MSGYQTLIFSALLAMVRVENGKSAAMENDGYAEFALRASGVSGSATKGPYKKQQLEAVVKDAEAFTVWAVAFSGNAHHLF